MKYVNKNKAHEDLINVANKIGKIDTDCAGQYMDASNLILDPDDAYKRKKAKQYARELLDIDIDISQDKKDRAYDGWLKGLDDQLEVKRLFDEAGDFIGADILITCGGPGINLNTYEHTLRYAHGGSEVVNVDAETCEHINDVLDY